MFIGLALFHVSINIVRMLSLWDELFLNFSVPESRRYFFLRKGLALS